MLSFHATFLYSLVYRIHCFLGLPDLVKLSRFLQTKKNFLIHQWSATPSLFFMTNVFVSFCSVMAQFRLIKHKFPNETFICVAFNSHMEWSNAQCVNAPTIMQVLFMASAALVTWYFCQKQECTKILENFWHFLFTCKKIIYQFFSFTCTHSHSVIVPGWLYLMCEIVFKGHTDTTLWF